MKLRAALTTALLGLTLACSLSDARPKPPPPQPEADATPLTPAERYCQRYATFIFRRVLDPDPRRAWEDTLATLRAQDPQQRVPP